MSDDPRESASAAWRQFLLSAVSDCAEPHDVFAWAYMAGWAHDKWPAIATIVPPPALGAVHDGAGGSVGQPSLSVSPGRSWQAPDPVRSDIAAAYQPGGRSERPSRPQP